MEGFEERPTTLGNSRPPVSRSLSTQMRTVIRTHTKRSHSIPAVLGPMSSFLPRAPGPQLDVGRLGGTWCETGQHPAAEPSQLPHRLFLFSSFPPFLPTTLQHLQWSLLLWRTALRASPITRCSGRAAGVTAHMSQHDRGVSCHACPLTFPTVRVQAESERREKNTLLPPWLPKCYHMVHSLRLSHGLSLSLSLSPSLGLSLIAAQTSESFMI